MKTTARFPRTAFTYGNWSFRPILSQTEFIGVDFYPKGQRSLWPRSGVMRLASDGKTWMFTVYMGAKGRPDARPTFAEAKAKILGLLNGGNGATS